MRVVKTYKLGAGRVLVITADGEPPYVVTVYRDSRIEHSANAPNLYVLGFYEIQGTIAEDYGKTFDPFCPACRKFPQIDCVCS